jgi:hypothetical protein
MGFTYNEEQQSISVDGHTGMKVSDIYNKASRVKNKYKDLNWNSGTLHMSDHSKMKQYNIYITRYNNKLLLKVKEKYHDAVFEEVFGLGCHCMNWSPETIISIH